MTDRPSHGDIKAEWKGASTRWLGGLVWVVLIVGVGLADEADAQGIEAMPETSTSGAPGSSRDLNQSSPGELGAEARASTMEESAWVGLQLNDDASDEALRIDHVVDGSPAARADLDVGDRLLEVGGEAMATNEQLQSVVERHAPGESLELTIGRDGAPQTVSVTLSAPPDRRTLIRSQLVGMSLPELTLERLAEKDEGVDEVELSTWRGNPMVIEFWASWCAPCRELRPTLRTLGETYGDELHVLGVSSEEHETLRSYHTEQDGLPYVVLRDEGRRLHERLLVSSYPTTLVVDASGEITHALFGLEAKERLPSLVESMMESASK